MWLVVGAVSVALGAFGVLGARRRAPAAAAWRSAGAASHPPARGPAVHAT